MTPEEVKTKLQKINNEQHDLFSSYLKYKKLEFEREQIQKDCPHTNAYLHIKDTDSYEGRTYGTIICHDCMFKWEERIYMGKCKYPKWEGGLWQ